MKKTSNGNLCCPICDSEHLLAVIEIEKVPIYCNVLWPTAIGAEKAARGEISLVFCQHCGHLFNTSFDPGLIDYDDIYENSLHFSPRFQQYASQLANRLINRYGIRDKDIIEIGAGQGDFLALLVNGGSNRGIGFDPAYKDEGILSADISFIKDYYGPNYADTAADLICSRHVFEHIPQPNQFLQRLRTSIGNRQEVIVFFEVPNALYTVQHGGIWDLIYEHVSYFTPHSLETAFWRNRFEVLDLSETFGGQFLTIEARPVQEERSFMPQLDTLNTTVANFADSYRKDVQKWQQFVTQLAAHGQRAVIWGAGSKGVTFLNMMKSKETITHAIDINPRKHGHFIAGTGQEIMPPEFLITHQPDYVIITNGNYQAEIKQHLNTLGVSAETIVV